MKTKAHFFPDLNLATILEPADPNDNKACTKIVTTIGPACQSVEKLVQMLNDGMSAARIDLTWGPIEYHRRSLDNLQEAMRKTRKLCAIMLDTLGREVMIRRPFRIDPDGWPNQAGQEIEVKGGQKLTLTTRDVECSATVFPITYPRFAEMMEPGDNVYLGRYLVSGADSASLYLEVLEVINGTDVVCQAKNDALLDGLLTLFHLERSTDALLNMQNDLPLLSDYDKECLVALGQEYEIDFVSLSYTRTMDDVVEARDFLDSVGLNSTKIFAKLESRQALLNFKGVLNEADGVIISRGNLGLDCLPEKMALIQKNLIQSCNLVGKPCLITRVMDTMAVTPRPTRAEATDVANAVLDGVDGILLGQETLRGEYPCEAVQTVIAICKQAEKVFDHHYHFDHLMDTAQEVEEYPPGQTPGEASPLEGSSEDLAGLEKQGHKGRGMVRNPSAESYSSLNLAIKAMTRFGASSYANLQGAAAMQHSDSTQRLYHGAPYLSKIDSTASSAPHHPLSHKQTLAPKRTHALHTRSLRAPKRASVHSTTPPDPPRAHNVRLQSHSNSEPPGSPYLSKIESIASSAVRAADKVKASLIVVYTHTGAAAACNFVLRAVLLRPCVMRMWPSVAGACVCVAVSARV
ncbi:MAG: pyruvate kinase [Monoraphidium minutum]|nr:MAG: pyruvate kinase [Monoraphidium minutum]